jgi:hypothetical protein
VYDVSQPLYSAFYTTEFSKNSVPFRHLAHLVIITVGAFQRGTRAIIMRRERPVCIPACRCNVWMSIPLSHNARREHRALRTRIALYNRLCAYVYLPSYNAPNVLLRESSSPIRIPSQKWAPVHQ